MDIIDTNRNVLLAKILGTKGLKGELKVKSFTEDALSLLDYPLFDENNRDLVIQKAYIHKDIVIVKFVSVDSIEEAECFIGASLYTKRDNFSSTEEDDFYYVDLVGLNVIYQSESIGKVEAVHNFNAGDILEIKKHNNEMFFLGFTKINVPTINIKEQFIEISSLEDTIKK